MLAMLLSVENSKWFQVSAQPLAAEVYPPPEGGQFDRKRNSHQD